MADTADSTADDSGQNDQQTTDSSQQQSDGDGKSQQQDPPPGYVPESKFNEAVATRQATKDKLREANAALEAAQRAAAGMPSAEDLQLLAEVKAAREEEGRNKALKDGDAEAIAAAARKPVEAERDAFRQDSENLRSQLTTLLRDEALGAAVRKSALGAVDDVVVTDALRARITMELVNGEFVPAFADAKGQPLYNATGKVTDMQEFVDLYLQAHPGLCKATAQPGSGGKPGGAPSSQTGKPQSIAEWNALSQEKRDELAPTMQPDDWARMGLKQGGGSGGFDF